MPDRAQKLFTFAVQQTGWTPLYDTVSREALQRLSPAHYQMALPYISASHRTRLPPWGEMLVHPFVVLAQHEGKGTEHAARSVLLKVEK